MTKEDNNIDEEEFKIKLLPHDYTKYDLSFKMIIIGDSNIGKSRLITKALNITFNNMATVGVEFLNFIIKINKKVIKIYIWDICGKEIYRSLNSNFYSNSSLAIILYSIDNKESFEHAENWLNDLKSQANPDIRIILVGNKSDLEEERKVTEVEGLKFRDDKGLDLFMETSAKTGYNATNVLIEATKLLYKDYYLKHIETDPNKEKEKNSNKLKKDYIKNIKFEKLKQFINY